MSAYVIAGIGTGIGKTVVSALLTEALAADYWKPVQAGDLDNSDTQKVRALTGNSLTFFHPEKYRLKAAMSPHAAAAREGITIQPDHLVIPETKNNLFIELAGGLMVPLNNSFLNADLLKRWDLPVILVSGNYLGSINHSLLTITFLQQYRIKIQGIIFNGEPAPESEDFILRYSRIPCLARIGNLDPLNKATVMTHAALLKPHLQDLLR